MSQASRANEPEQRAGSGATSAPADGSRSSLMRSAGVVGGNVLVSRVLGLVREQVFAGFFGAGRELDAFITAFRIPNLFRDLFAEGALSAAFVTCFTQTLEQDGEARAWRLANLVLHALCVVVGALVLLGMIAAPQVVGVIAPGFAAVPGKSALTVELTRIMFPFLLLVALAALAMGMLNAKGRFGVPAAASSFFNLGSVVVGLGSAWWLAPDYIADVWHRGASAAAAHPPAAVARAITGMAIGTLVGGALQLFVQLPSLHRLRYRYRPLLSFRDPGVRRVMALMGPATIGAAAVQINVLVNNNFASYLGDGAVSWLNVAFRFMQLPIGVFGVAVGVVALPAVSRSAARADMASFRATTMRALRLVFALCIPAAVGLAVLAPELIGVVYQHGRFNARDTEMAAHALVAYAVGLAGYANIKVLVPAFYALGDARTPASVSCLSILVNALFNWLAVRMFGLGHVGLALATSVVAMLNLTLLFVVLQRRIGGLTGLGGALLRILGSSLVVVLVCYAVKVAASQAMVGGSTVERLVVLTVATPLAFAAYVGAASWLGIGEISDLLGRFRSRGSSRG